MGRVMSLINTTPDGFVDAKYVIAGSGEVRLFDQLSLGTYLRLRYVDSTSLASGVHIIHYEPDNTYQ